MSLNWDLSDVLIRIMVIDSGEDHQGKKCHSHRTSRVRLSTQLISVHHLAGVSVSPSLLLSLHLATLPSLEGSYPYTSWKAADLQRLSGIFLSLLSPLIYPIIYGDQYGLRNIYFLPWVTI